MTFTFIKGPTGFGVARAGFGFIKRGAMRVRRGAALGDYLNTGGVPVIQTRVWVGRVVEFFLVAHVP